jgi:hypothetical protein
MGPFWQAGLMMDTYRRILWIGLASLLFIGLSGISPAESNDGQDMIAPGEQVPSQDRVAMPPHEEDFHMGAADPVENQKMMEPGEEMGFLHDDDSRSYQNEGFPMGVPREILYIGRGFALKNNESHIIRLKVETIMPLQSGQIRDLLSSNKSLEEIRNEIQAREAETGAMAFRGSMILDRDIYPLVNIAINATGNNSTAIQANLAGAEKQTINDTSTGSGLSIIISPSDGGMIGNGELEIKNGPKMGRYSLLIHMEPPRQGQKKMMRGG